MAWPTFGSFDKPRMWFTEDTDEIFGEKLEKGRAGHFTEKYVGNRKHRPKVQKRQTEACVYQRERDRCGWTGTKPERLNTNT